MDAINGSIPENNDGSDYSLATLHRDGKPPHTRMANADKLIDMARRLEQSDARRSWLRSRVAGIVGGNPPYQNNRLREANSANRANVNWGTARAYMESGAGAFYDLFSEAPGLVAIFTKFGRDQKERDFYSHIMSAEADRILLNDPLFDYVMQQSQWEMTLFGCGPLVFEDAFRVVPRSIHCGDLKVPERTKADVEYFEIAMVDIDWYPGELYEFIKNPEAAKAAGWNLDFTRRVIAEATDISMPDSRTFDWEFYQQELKNSSFSYYDDSKVNRCCLAFWQEFDGRITQAIVEREATTSEGADWMFRHVGRYANWHQCLHPFYADRGHGGFHHSVTGLGVKLFGPMSHENRLLCNLYDKAHAPDILFRPTTTEATQKFQLAHFSQYGVLPQGYDTVQMPVKGYVQDGLAMFRTSSELMKSNLSGYRQPAPMQQRGNPRTRFEVEQDVGMASGMQKTATNRYYKQLDQFYAEVVRRLCNLNSPDPRAKEFQKTCEDQGVPMEALGRLMAVRAVRVVGEGSPMLRKNAIQSIAPIAGSLPENGRANWLSDYVAAYCGNHAVNRYIPHAEDAAKPDQQDAMAWLQVSAMKNGLPPIMTDEQNHLKFAGVFLKAAVQAFQSLQQGANPATVVPFVDIAAPSAMAHLKKIAGDPLRKEAVEAVSQQLQQLMTMLDQIKKKMQEQAQKQQEQQQKTQAAQSDAQLKAQKLKGDLTLKAQKQQATLQMQKQKHDQQLAIADATSASQIHRENQRAKLASVQE